MMMSIRLMQERVEEILNEGRHLTKWENQFLESLSDRLMQNRGLSDREEEVVNRIYQKCIEGGV